MAPPDTIWHKESLKLKEIFGTREGFEICPNKFSQRPIISPPLYALVIPQQTLSVRCIYPSMRRSIYMLHQQDWHVCCTILCQTVLVGPK